MKVAVGDSATFNFIDKPDGGISGTITNSTIFTAQRYFIRLYVPELHDVSFEFETERDGEYTFDGIPEGTYYAEAGMSIVGGDEWQWKVHARHFNENGDEKEIVIGSSIVPGINWEFTTTDTDTTTTKGEVKGDGVLTLTVIDSIQAMYEKGMVLLFEKLPSEGEHIQPLRYYHLEGYLPHLTPTTQRNQCEQHWGGINVDCRGYPQNPYPQCGLH